MATSSEHFFDFLCRTCMSTLTESPSCDAIHETDQQWQSIFDRIEDCDALQIAQLLSNTVPQIMEVQQTDELPKKICSKCLVKLLSVYQFQQLCLQTDQKMRALIAERNAGVKTEAALEDEIDTTDLLAKEALVVVNEHKIEFDPVNTSPEIPEVVADPLSSLTELVKNEPSEDDVAFSDDETQQSTVTVKDEVMAAETEAEQLDSADNDDEQDITPVHSKKKGISFRFKCDVCGRNFLTAETLHNHRLVHENKTDKMNYCNMCEKKYSSWSALRKHTKRHSKKEGISFRFKCHVCGRNFLTAETLHNHRLVHEDKTDKMNYCDMCEKKFSSWSALTKHKKLHLVKKKDKIVRVLNHKCVFCDKIYKNPESLEKHVWRLHTCEGFLCPECGKSFKNERRFKLHCARHAKDKSYECPHCPTTFNCASKLYIHKEIHFPKKHVCDECGSAFTHRHGLKDHKKSHSGERPFKCDYCEKCFIRPGHKRRHMCIHTGEKPYKCQYCDYAAAGFGDRLKHLKRIHKIIHVHRCSLCPLTFRLGSEMRLHFATHKHDDEETRARNLKALKEEEAKLDKQSAAGLQ